MEEYKCQYCAKTFSSKSNLKNHEMKAKYCLNIRDYENNDFQCKFCEKVLSSKFRLDHHYDNCKQKFKIEYKQKHNDLLKKYKEQENIIFKQQQKIENYEQRIDEYKTEVKDLKEEIKELQNQMKDLTEKAIQKAIDKPTYSTTNSNNSNNRTVDNRTLNMIPMNLTQESILKTLQEKFTENHLMQGQKGLADFCIENILVKPDGKYLMKCTDPSRKIFVYIDEEGQSQKDVNAEKFTRMINGPVKKVSKKIYDGLYDRYTNHEDEDEEKEEVDEDRLSFATDKLVEISSLKNDNSEFVKRLVPPLTN